MVNWCRWQQLLVANAVVEPQVVSNRTQFD